jgi:amino acid transporter
MSPPDADRLLSRELGVRQLAAIVFNYTVGSGIFALPAVAASHLGAAAILAYLVCAVVIGLVVICFSEAGSRVSATGGPYAYVEAGLGSLAGFVTGTLLVVSDLAAVAAVANLFATTVGRFVGTGSRAVEGTLIGAVLLIVAAINTRGVRQGARLVEIFAVAKLVPLLGFALVGAWFVRVEHLPWTTSGTQTDIIGTAGILIFAFAGIESALQPSGEVKNPAFTVPRATFLALGAVTVLYIAVQVVAQGVLGSVLAEDHVAPLANAAAMMIGTPGRMIMLAAAAISTFGWLSGAILASPRSLFAFARDGLAPRQLAAVHKAHHTPHIAIATYAAVAFALALTGSFEKLAVLSNVGAFLVYITVAISVLRLRHRNIQSGGTPFRVPGGPAVPLLTCASMVWLLVETATGLEFAAVGMTVAFAIAVHGLRSWRRSRVLAPAAATAPEDF